MSQMTVARERRARPGGEGVRGRMDKKVALGKREKNRMDRGPPSESAWGLKWVNMLEI